MLAAFALALAATPARAAGIADGTYSCTMSFTTALGRLDIAGGRFTAKSREVPESAAYPIAVSEKGEIALEGPVAILTKKGLELTAARMVKPGRSESGFMLTVKNKDGVFHTVFCG